METPLSGAASGMAEVVTQKWFAAMGIIGLLLFVTTFVIEIPADVIITRCVALMMFGWGFGQTECRTLRKTISPDNRYLLTGPVWRLTVSGALLFAIASGAAIYLVLHVLDRGPSLAL